MRKNSLVTSDIIDITINTAAPHFWKKEQERARRDLIKTSKFQHLNNKNNSYRIHLSTINKKIILSVLSDDKLNKHDLIISMSPYRQIIRDYFMLIESYEQIRSQGNLQKLETIDMGRRGLHNEGAELLQDRLKEKISMDHETARLFFTLICTLWHN